MYVDEIHARENSIKSDENDDLTAPFYEAEEFHSIWEAIKWKHVRARVPVCFKKILRSRYMLANLVYLIYTIGFIVIDFNFPVNASPDSTSTNSTETISDTTTVTISILDQPAEMFQ